MPVTSSSSHITRLEGINAAFPEPIPLDPRASKENTIDACKLYKVKPLKPPSLNADFCRSLLADSDIAQPLQDSLVLGWEAGFDFGSELDDVDHFASPSAIAQDQEEALKAGLLAEVQLGRMVDPLKTSISDGLWFDN